MLRAFLLSAVAVTLSLALSSPLTAGEKYAFLVGVSGYDEKELKPLQYPRNDILEFRDVLLESGFKPENITLMVDDLAALPRTTPAGRFLPECNRIKKELQLLIPALEADDSLVIALAGHGVQFKGEAEPYYCPLDASLGDRNTLLSLTWLYDQLKFDSKTNSGCRARQRLLLVDACRNDPAAAIRRNSADGPKLESSSLPQMVPPPEGVVALFSCAEGQEALEHDPLKHGVFFYHVLEGFRGQADADDDQQLTLDELIAFTKSKTQTYARVNLAAPQTPRQKGFFDGTWTLRAISSKVITNSIGMKLVMVPAGQFLMGSTSRDLDEVVRFDPTFKNEYAADEQPQHTVRIARPFYLGVHEVTKGQFAEFVRSASYKTEAERDGNGGYGTDSKGSWTQKPEYSWKNPGFPQTDTHPVVNVTWNDAVAFSAWLSRKEGKTYRLPTEAEWEYACRAKTTTLFQHGHDSDGLAAVGNVADASLKAKFSERSTISADDGSVFTAPVGRYRPNAFGLFDMHGNVIEWCNDWYGEKYYSSSPSADPTGPSSGSFRVLRGGGWRDTAGSCRSAFRGRSVPSDRFINLGFRVALSPLGE